jgi:hypothetical protein
MHLLIKNKLKFVMSLICIQIIYVWLILDPTLKVCDTFFSWNPRLCNVYDCRAFILPCLLTVFVLAFIGTQECMCPGCWRVFSVFSLQGTIVLCIRIHDIRKKTQEVKQRTQQFSMADHVLQSLEVIFWMEVMVHHQICQLYSNQLWLKSRQTKDVNNHDLSQALISS